MSKNTKGILVVLVMAGLAVGIYFILGTGNTVSKAQQIQFLIANKNTSGTPDQLNGFGSDYIAAWYGAAKAGQPTFDLAGKTYNTGGGTAVTA